MNVVPEIRLRQVNGRAINPDGDFVLYWMIAFRRTEWNFSLQRAVELSRKLKKPLVILEALRADYQWASDRIHHFVIQGMADNAKRLQRKPVLYYPYLEPKPGAGKGLLAELAKRSCAVVSDDFPCFFLPRMITNAASQVPVQFELVDSNGLLPMRAADRVFSRAFDFRRFLQKNLRGSICDHPRQKETGEIIADNCARSLCQLGQQAFARSRLRFEVRIVEHGLPLKPLCIIGHSLNDKVVYPIASPLIVRAKCLQNHEWLLQFATQLDRPLQTEIPLCASKRDHPIQHKVAVRIDSSAIDLAKSDLGDDVHCDAMTSDATLLIRNCTLAL